MTSTAGGKFALTSPHALKRTLPPISCTRIRYLLVRLIRGKSRASLRQMGWDFPRGVLALRVQIGTGSDAIFLNAPGPRRGASGRRSRLRPDVIERGISSDTWNWSPRDTKNWPPCSGAAVFCRIPLRRFVRKRSSRSRMAVPTMASPNTVPHSEMVRFEVIGVADMGCFRRALPILPLPSWTAHNRKPDGKPFVSAPAV